MLTKIVLIFRSVAFWFVVVCPSLQSTTLEGKGHFRFKTVQEASFDSGGPGQYHFFHGVSASLRSRNQQHQVKATKFLLSRHANINGVQTETLPFAGGLCCCSMHCKKLKPMPRLMTPNFVLGNLLKKQPCIFDFSGDSSNAVTRN